MGEEKIPEDQALNSKIRGFLYRRLIPNNSRQPRVTIQGGHSGQQIINYAYLTQPGVKSAEKLLAAHPSAASSQPQPVG